MPNIGFNKSILLINLVSSPVKTPSLNFWSFMAENRKKQLDDDNWMQLQYKNIKSPYYI